MDTIPNIRLKTKSERANTSPANEPGLTISLDGHSQFVSAESQEHIEILAELLKKRPRKRKSIVVTFSHVETWEPAFRWFAFGELLSTINKLTFSVQPRGQKHKSLFQSLLTLVGNGTGGIAYDAQIRNACCEAAALEHKDNLGDACAQILQAHKAHKKHCPKLEALVKTVTGLVAGNSRRASGPAERAAREYIAHLLPAGASPEAKAIPWLAYHRDEWYVYDGELWGGVKDRDLFARVTRHLQSHSGESIEIKESLVRDVGTNLKGLSANWPCNLQMPMWRGESGEVTSSRYLACGNGLLDLQPIFAKDGPAILHPFSARHFSTARLGFDFDEAADCPKWKESLSQILPRQSKTDRRTAVLQEFFGWCLSTDELRLEKFLVPYGPGGNGKSVVLGILCRLLGKANVSALPIEHLGNEFRVAEIVGKLANIAAEMDRVERFEEGILKQLVSWDPVQINRKFKDPITIISYAKLVFSTNQLPAVNDRSDGIFRRMIPMPFLEKFRDEDANKLLLNELETELAGIANWALAGLARLVKTQRFTRCSMCNESLEKHRLNCDAFLQFIAEECYVRPEICDAKYPLYESYKKWCENHTRRATSSSEFYSRVLALPGVAEGRPGTAGSRPRVFFGIQRIHSRSICDGD